MRDPESGTDDLRLERFFDGVVRGWGYLDDRRSGASREIAVAMTGTWADGVLVLDQSLDFGEGAVDRRLWRIRPRGTSGYEGIAVGIAGTAVATCAGRRVRWTYETSLTVGDDAWQVTCEEELEAHSDRLVVDRIVVRSAGLVVAEITLILSRPRESGTRAD